MKIFDSIKTDKGRYRKRVYNMGSERKLAMQAAFHDISLDCKREYFFYDHFNKDVYSVGIKQLQQTPKTFYKNINIISQIHIDKLLGVI